MIYVIFMFFLVNYEIPSSPSWGAGRVVHLFITDLVRTSPF